MALSPGTRLGVYEIVGQLGSGGMGEVYEARDSSLRRDVAIKLLPETFTRDPDRLRRFTTEAQACAALNHPNILSIFQVGELNGEPYIVSELLEGQTLRDATRDGPLPVRRVIDYGIQIARGLAAAHCKGIIHRDLKPENIFVTKDGRVKILDFGLAKSAEHAQGNPADSPTLTAGTEVGVVLGTAGYMSPEQVRCESIDQCSDIFSLGVVLYEMMAGRRAFLRKTSAETMAAILKEDPPPPDAARELSPALSRILQHCLEKEPAARFQSAQDLAFALESLTGLSPNQTKMSAGTRPSPRWRRPAALAASLLGALALGVLLHARFTRSSNPKWNQLTFSKGMISNARFAPDGQTIVYSAAWNGRPFDIYATRPESPESRSLGQQKTNLLAVSTKGELAVTRGIQVVGINVFTGTLSRVPLEGGTPREIMHDVQFADWAPGGAALAIVHRVHGRSVLEYPVGHHIAESSGYIAFPRFSPSGDEIAYFDYADPTLDYGKVVVAKPSGEKKVLSEGWSDLTGLAWTSQGKEIWFTGSRNNGAIDLYALSANGSERIILKQANDLQLMDLASDGRVLLASTSWRGEMYGATSGDSSERALSWLDFSVPDDISSDGSAILFHENGTGGGANNASYLQILDGSPPVKLGEFVCGGLSPDQQWAVCQSEVQPNPLVLVPTRAGVSRTLPRDQLTHIMAKWFPDNQRLLLTASEPGHATRLYVQELAGQPARPFSPDGIAPLTARVSPDGKWVAANTDQDEIFLFSPYGANPALVPGIREREVVVGWSQDSRSIFVAALGELPVPVFRVEVASGTRKLWRTLSPPDPAGVDFFNLLFVTPNSKAYIYGFDRRLCDLFVLTGLQ